MKVFLRPTVRSSWALTPKSTVNTRLPSTVCTATRSKHRRPRDRRRGGEKNALPRESAAAATRSQLTEFDLGVLGQQDVLALDVPVDDVVGVQVGQALRGETERGPVTELPQLSRLWRFWRLKPLRRLEGADRQERRGGGGGGGTETPTPPRRSRGATDRASPPPRRHRGCPHTASGRATRDTPITPAHHHPHTHSTTSHPLTSPRQ